MVLWMNKHTFIKVSKVNLFYASIVFPFVQIFLIFTIINKGSLFFIHRLSQNIFAHILNIKDMNNWFILLMFPGYTGSGRSIQSLYPLSRKLLLLVMIWCITRRSIWKIGTAWQGWTATIYFWYRMGRASHFAKSTTCRGRPCR